MGHLVTSFNLVRRWTLSWKMQDWKIMWSTHGKEKTKATEWAAPENCSDKNWNCPIDNALPSAGVRQKCRWWRHSPEEMHRNLSEYASDIGENCIFRISEKCFTSQVMCVEKCMCWEQSLISFLTQCNENYERYVPPVFVAHKRTN